MLLSLLLLLLGIAATNSDNAFSPPIPPKTTYHVFISFRGTDIRQGFLGHLIKELSRKRISTFVDYKLDGGDEISPALLRAIERSSLSLVIFSKNYANSHWCLD